MISRQWFALLRCAAEYLDHLAATPIPTASAFPETSCCEPIPPAPGATLSAPRRADTGEASAPRGVSPVSPTP